MIRLVIAGLYNAMIYHISKLIGWLLLILNLWLVVFNYANPKIYILLIYCVALIFLSGSFGSKLKYQKNILLYLQLSVFLLMGYRVVNRWLYVYSQKNIGGIHDEGSPLAFLIGSGIEIVILSILIISIIEVFIKKGNGIGSVLNSVNANE